MFMFAACSLGFVVPVASLYMSASRYKGLLLGLDGLFLGLVAGVSCLRCIHARTVLRFRFMPHWASRFCSSTLVPTCVELRMRVRRWSRR